MRRTALALTLAATAFAATALGTAHAAAVPAAAAGCWSATVDVYYPSEAATRWHYAHRVEWCGDGTSIISARQTDVSMEVFDDRCTWLGLAARDDGEAARAWDTFTMGTVECRDGAGAQPYQLNPWAVLTALPDGSYTADGGVAGGPPAAGVTP